MVMQASALRCTMGPGAMWPVLIALLLAFPAPSAEKNGTNSAVLRYEFRQQHDPDGIGKFYMGREIAQVMGHQAADWLERPEREQEEHTQEAIAALKLKA